MYLVGVKLFLENTENNCSNLSMLLNKSFQLLLILFLTLVMQFNLSCFLYCNFKI